MLVIKISHYDAFPLLTSFVAFCMFVLSSSFMLGLRLAYPIVTIEFLVTMLHQTGSISYTILFSSF